MSPRDAALHIGIATCSVQEARRRFVRELRAWRLLVDGHTVDGDLT